jgi:hypothetical protein
VGVVSAPVDLFGRRWDCWGGWWWREVVVAVAPTSKAVAVPTRSRERWGSVLGNDVRGELYLSGGGPYGAGYGGLQVVVVVGGARTKRSGDLGPPSKTGWRGSVLTNDVRGLMQIDGGRLHSTEYGVPEVVVVVGGARAKERGDLGPPRKTERCDRVTDASGSIATIYQIQ